MPEYQMDTSGSITLGKPMGYFSADSCIRWNDLDSFTQGYIEAMFWTSEAPGVTTEEWQATEEHNEGSIPGDVGFNDLAPSALAEIIADCKAWQEENATLLELAYEREGYSDPAQAGHDYWLTRNGHGVGFWDRTPLAFVPSGQTEELGDLLSDACRYRDVDCYLGDDGKVYVS